MVRPDRRIILQRVLPVDIALRIVSIRIRSLMIVGKSGLCGIIDLDIGPFMKSIRHIHMVKGTLPGLLTSVAFCISGILKDVVENKVRGLPSLIGDIEKFVGIAAPEIDIILQVIISFAALHQLLQAILNGLQESRSEGVAAVQSVLLGKLSVPVEILERIAAVRLLGKYFLVIIPAPVIRILSESVILVCSRDPAAVSLLISIDVIVCLLCRHVIGACLHPEAQQETRIIRVIISRQVLSRIPQ